MMSQVNLHSKSPQRGIALFTVLIMMLLSLLLVLGASKTALFNELITGNDADYQRALEAAQLLVKDAERDIIGYKDDGTPCNASSGFIGCHANSGAYFPRDIKELPILADRVASNTPSCSNGICTNLCPSATTGFCVDTAPRFWNSTAMLNSMTPQGAKYGQYTLVTPGTTGNKILTGGKSWYWVEVIQYAEFYIGKVAAAPDDKSFPFIYRITAVAQGAKPGTQAVVQTLVAIRRP